MKYLILLLIVAIGLTGGLAIGQTDLLGESVTTIQQLELEKDVQITSLELANFGFNSEIQSLNNDIDTATVLKDVEDSELTTSIATAQTLLDQITAAQNAP